VQVRQVLQQQRAAPGGGAAGSSRCRRCGPAGALVVGCCVYINPECIEGSPRRRVQRKDVFRCALLQQARRR
jgi:hypothetical protein